MAIILGLFVLLLLGVLVEYLQSKEAEKRKALYERALKASKRAKALQASRLHEAMQWQNEEPQASGDPKP